MEGAVVLTACRSVTISDGFMCMYDGDWTNACCVLLAGCVAGAMLDVGGCGIAISSLSPSALLSPDSSCCG